MAGNQSRGLIAASKTKGWDPTVIAGGESIANFDKDQTNANIYGVGRIPGGPPPQVDTSMSHDAVMPGKVEFAHPDFTRETANRATRNADPFSGKQEG